jgi:hypothetical protein
VSYIDGTKIESVANKYTFVWKKSVEKNKAKLQAKIHSVLSQIDEGIAQDNSPEEDSPQEIDSSLLRARIDELNRSGKHQDEGGRKQLKELEKHHDKLREYEEKLDVLVNRNSYSKTDKDATFMRMKEDAMNNGQTKPGYNVQIGTENQYVTNYGLYHSPSDATTLSPFLILHQARLGVLPKAVCSDAGYGSEENYDFLEKNKIDAYVKYNYFHQEQKKKFREQLFRIENLMYDESNDTYTCPQGKPMKFLQEETTVLWNGYKRVIRQYQADDCKGCPLKEQCHKAKGNRIIHVNEKLRGYKNKARDLLTSEQGLKHRSKRPIEPEAVFGQIKFNKAYKRFRHRGWDKVNMDFGIFLISFNLQKLWNKTRKKQRLTGQTHKNKPVYALKVMFIAFAGHKKQSNDNWRDYMAA